MPGRFLRLALVQGRGERKPCLDRRVARIAMLDRCFGSTRAAARASALALSSSGSVAPPPIFLDQLLQHAGGFLAARHAEIQPLLGVLHDLVGVGLAGVAALAAILLAPWRPSCAGAAAGPWPSPCARHLVGRVVPRRLIVLPTHRIRGHRNRRRRDRPPRAGAAGWRPRSP